MVGKPSAFGTAPKDYPVEYNCWMSMIDRCLNSNNKNYSRYGGRGIEVCLRWEYDFRNFLEDMGERPSESHSIDRIDNNGNYEPSNCRWATKTEQSRNRGLLSTNTSGINGVRWDGTRQQWYVSIYVDKKNKYIGRYNDLEKAKAARKEAEDIYWR